MEINEKTKISLFAVLGILAPLALFIFWFSGVVADARSGAASSEVLAEIKLDLREIKTDVKYIKEKKWTK